MSKNIVKIATQFLLICFLLHKKQKLKNNPQKTQLHVFIYWACVATCGCLPSLHRKLAALRRCCNPSRFLQIFNLSQNLFIHLPSFPVEPPAVFLKIPERAFYMRHKHFFVFIAFFCVVVDYLNARKIQCL